MSHTKAGGSTRNGRDSSGRRLGVKLFGGQTAQTGDILIRQRGSKFEAGPLTFMGKDYTIHAAEAGTVSFREVRKTGFAGTKARKTVVYIEPFAA